MSSLEEIYARLVPREDLVASSALLVSYAEAMNCAQLLEQAMLAFLVVLRSEKVISSASEADLDKVFADLDKAFFGDARATLGQKIGIVSEHLDNNCTPSNLKKALEHRNFLAHKFFLDGLPLFSCATLRSKRLEELHIMKQELFAALDDILRKIDSWLDSYSLREHFRRQLEMQKSFGSESETDMNG